MPRLNAKECARQLLSPKWSDRIAVQKELGGIIRSQDWKEVLVEIPSSNYPVIRMTTGHLKAFMLGNELVEVSKLILFLLATHSPLSRYKDLCCDILETFLSAPRLSYRNKTDILIQFFSDEIAISDEVLRYIIRALGYLRARRAITYFEKEVENSSDETVHEIIKAIRQIRDRKSGRCLEGIFHSKNRVLVAAAVAAYGDLGGNYFWRALRLYMLYSRSPENVRLAIIYACCRFQMSLATRLLLSFYKKEGESQIRIQILKRLAALSSVVGTRFLLRVASRASNISERNSARWCLETLTRDVLLGTWKRAIKSRDLWEVNWAILKAADIRVEIALKQLGSFLTGRRKLPPLLKLSLIESLGRMKTVTHNEKIETYLLEQIGQHSIASVSACIGLLRRANPDVLAILDRAEGESLEVLQTCLALMAESKCKVNHELKKRMCAFIASHSAFSIRYLASRFLLADIDRDAFYVVWNQAGNESLHCRKALTGLLGSSISHGVIPPEWYPLGRGENAGLLKEVLGCVKTGSWVHSYWRRVIGLLSNSVGFLMTDMEDQLSEGEIILWEFLNHEKHFWSEIFNDLLVEEKDPIVMRLLTALIRANEGAVKEVTLKSLFARVVSGESIDCQPIFEMFSYLRPKSLLLDFVDWSVGLPDGFQKQMAYRALGSWISANASSSQRERIAA